MQKNLFRIIMVCVLAFASGPLFSQTCNPYFAIREGVKSTYEFYNSKGKVTNRHSTYFKEVSGSGDNLKASMVTEMIDVKNDKIMSSTTTLWQCENGVVRFQMGVMNLEGVDMTNTAVEVAIDGDEMEIPSNLNAGERLKDISYHVVITMSGIRMMDRNIHIKERKVEGNEKITTPAGTFDCTKVTYITESVNRNGKAAKPVDSSIWYAKDIGMVKMEDSRDGKVAYAQVLVKREL